MKHVSRLLVLVLIGCIANAAEKAEEQELPDGLELLAKFACYGTAFSLEFTSNGQLLVVGYASKMIRLHDVPTTQLVVEWECGELLLQRGKSEVATEHKGVKFVCRNADTTTKVVEGAEGRTLASWPAENEPDIREPQTIAQNEDAFVSAVYKTEDGVTLHCDNGAQTVEIPRAISAAYSPDSKHLAVGDETGTVRLFQMRKNPAVKAARS